MPRFRQLRLVALVGALLMVAASCGQKPGVALSAGSGGVAAGDPSLGTGAETVPTGEAAVTPGEPAAPTPAPGAPAAPTATAAPRRTAAPPRAPGASAPGQPAPTAPAAAGKQDRTGIDDAKKEIVIGIHAPVTGAAPIEQKTFENGRDVYWQFVRDNGGILGGYNVRVVFRDDQFSPTVARQKCQEMVENEKAFLLIGGAGADQITSCARYAEGVGVPYLSAGVNTEGLDGLKHYFAVSMTYAQQAPLLAGLIKNRIGKTNVGLAVLDTPDFVDARKAAIAAIQAAGGRVVADEKIPKTAGKNE
ncbi:MAG: ABC transporter substrate-binding protein, partial [Actinobacteria bacterium]|nr:ABC transporter substrate-binding protein [Actinomycetota bacterium]